MKLTTKGRFAVTAMLDLALNEKGMQLNWLKLVKGNQFRCHILNNYLGN